MASVGERLDNLLDRVRGNEGVDRGQSRRLDKLERRVEALERKVEQRVKTLDAEE